MKPHTASQPLVWLLALLGWYLTLLSAPVHAELLLPNTPLAVSVSATPLTLLSASRDHKLYYEAYNDASDLNGDGFLDIGYKPTITYYGYFDSYKCYNYNAGVFEPVYLTVSKTCSLNTGRWSGDYLNYLTMTRMDALRRVLYGGYRSTDDAGLTILERAFIPQDAHSWGKEYTSTTLDGYNISDYTPLSQPSTGKRHIFANTTLYGTSAPLLRVLSNTSYRVWEWVSIERPVAGTQCATGNNSRADCAGSGSTINTTHPSDHATFATLVSTYANADHLLTGPTSISTIKYDGNRGDNYITVISGTLTIDTKGDYEFAVDGDDAVEVIISGTNGTSVVGYYGAHGKCNCKDNKITINNLAKGTYTITFWHEEVSGSDNFYFYWKRPSQDWAIVPALKDGRGLSNLTESTYNRIISSAATLTDYTVRVKTCVSGLLEPECRGYPTGTPTAYKPIGILQQYGEDDSMAFGLMTGSYTKNTSGGVLRKNLSSLKDEINLNTGRLSATVGVIQTLDKLKITGFGSGYSYDQNCSVPEVNQSLSEGRCRMWGNPIAEIMYEGVRYLGGKTSPTAAFAIADSGNDDADLGLPKPDWLDPYRTEGGYPYCAKPSQIVISDIDPNFDTDQMPGRYEYTAPATMASFSGDASLNSHDINVSGLGDLIWDGEFGSGVTKNLFIGQSQNSYDGAPTAKSANSFGNIRGLAPEEPSQQGGYYSASIAHFAKTNDIHAITGAQKVDTYSIALASPKPNIEFPIGVHTVSLVPFGKTVGGCGSIDRTQGKYQPTNTIVDFYVLAFNNTNTGNQDASVNSGRPYAKFRINYEDSEYGSDHDMDAIVEYELTATSNHTLDVKLTSDYAAGGCIQHMGYVISGTTADGTYLDVRDSDTSEAQDLDYFLDTPNSAGVALPLTNTRTFTAGTSASAQFVPHDPLWYASKWGSFTDRNKNDLPDLVPEWDGNADGVPDTYFLVQNPLKLKEALKRAFDNIIERTGSAGNVTSNSTAISTDSQVFQSLFNTATWSGNLLAYPVSDLGVGATPTWQANQNIPDHTARKIFSRTDSTAIEFLWANLSDVDKTALVSENVVNFLRGDRSGELQNGGTLRNRTTHVLGDIVHSSPYYVKDNNTVFVGANDGMLHAFNASTGVEVFAYIPSQLLPKLKNLSDVNYGSTSVPHDYFVDGDIAVSTRAETSSHNYLVGTLGQGGKGLFGLDVYNPSTFGTSKVLWEKSNTSTPEGGVAADAYVDIGYMLGRPVIAKMNNNKTAVIVGNGYNSTNGKAVLYVFELDTGKLIKKFDTLVAEDNGMSSPAVYDNNNDGTVDVIYAGDLKGNVWKFDVSGNTANTWDVAFMSGINPAPFFVAKDASDNVQPITAQITVSLDNVANDLNAGKRFIFFGTGSYFRTADPNDKHVQTWYGLIDEGLQIANRSELVQRTVVEEGTFSNAPVRSFSAVVEGDMVNKKGWYMDLTEANGTAVGERMVTSSRVYKFAEPTLIASSIVPVTDPCVPGGRGYLNAVNPWTGARLSIGFFDVNGNSSFTDDKLSDNLIGSVDLGVGMPSEAVVVGDRLVVGGSAGLIEDIKINSGIVPNKGRISWRELISD